MRQGLPSCRALTAPVCPNPLTVLVCPNLQSCCCNSVPGFLGWLAVLYRAQCLHLRAAFSWYRMKRVKWQSLQCWAYSSRHVETYRQEACTVVASLQSPARAGCFRSVLNGMHEHVAWFSQARSVAEGILATVALMQDSRLPCFGRGAPIPNLRKRFHLDMTEAKAAAFMRSTILDAYDKARPHTALLFCHAAWQHVPHGFYFARASVAV